MPLTGDGYFAGEYPGGTTTVEGAPVSAAVLVYQRDSGQLIAQTESSQSGEWIVTGVDISKAHDIVGRKEGFNDVIVSNVMPTSMVVITYIDKILPNETFTGALGYLELVGGIPPYAASVVDPLPAGIFPVVNGRQLIIDGTTTDDGVFNSTVRITSSNGATKDVPVKLVVGFKAPANFEAETLEDAGTFSVILTWEVTNTTQEVRVFKSTTPFDLESMPTPIATLTGDAVSYTDDDVIEDDVFYYMTASVCESFTLYSNEVREVVVDGDPHWDNVVALLRFDGDLTDETGRVWDQSGAPIIGVSGRFGGCITFSGSPAERLSSAHQAFGTDDWTVEMWVKFNYTSGQQNFFENLNSAGINPAGRFTIYQFNGSLRIYINSGDRVITPAPSTNTWHHLSVSCESGLVRLFVDGTIKGSWNSGGLNFNQTLTIFGAGFGTNSLYGSLDELRITKGVARYTENFTPPTEPFPNE